MKQSIVVSVLGEDSPGLVAALSKLIVQFDGDWVESSMTSLAGKFAGILRIEMPRAQVDAFTHALTTEKIGLKVIFETSETPINDTPLKSYQIELIGQDQPGIVHRLSNVLAQLGVNVELLESEIIEASMSGEQLFKATLHLKVPNEIEPSTIQQALEKIANELIVDIELAESSD